jgi:zinc protease
MKTLTLLSLLLISFSLPRTTLGEQNVKKNAPVLLPVKNDPTISFRIWFEVGSQNDPRGKEGLASITASMLTDASTQNNSYAEIINKLYPLAASYNASSSVEMTVIYGRTHKDNLKEYYSLFTDAILRPAFKQEDLDRIKSQVLNYLENTLRYASDEELGKAVLYNQIFAGTPYGHIDDGTIDAVKSITLDDVREFYKRYYTRDNLVIGLGGGYNATLLDRLKKDLQTLPAGMPKPVSKPQPEALKGFHVTIVEKDAPATAISMGFPIDVLRGTKDWYALAIANSWLGEHRNSSSHLYQVIREERGLNYGDYSYIENYPNGGMRQLPPQNVSRRQQIFEIWIRPVPNETRHFALRAALREFKHLVDKGMTKGDFELTREFLSKYVLHYAATTMERLGYALDDRFYGIQGSHLQKFRQMMKTVTLRDVNGAIKRHLQYGNMEIAIITKDAKGFKDALVNDAPSPITYGTPKPESVLNEDKEISVFPVKVKAENIKIVPVADLFEK